MNVNISATHQPVSFSSPVFHDLRRDALKRYDLQVHGEHISQHVLGVLVSDENLATQQLKHTGRSICFVRGLYWCS